MRRLTFGKPVWLDSGGLPIPHESNLSGMLPHPKGIVRLALERIRNHGGKMLDTIDTAPPHDRQDLVEEIDCALTRAKRLLARAESRDETWFLEMTCAKLFEAFAWAESAAYAPKEDS